MGVTIHNKTAKPIWLRLNSGNTLSIFPTQNPPEVEENEIENNPAIEKLLARDFIEKVRSAKREHEPKTRKSTPKSRGRGSK